MQEAQIAVSPNRLSSCPCVLQSTMYHLANNDNLGYPWGVLDDLMGIRMMEKNLCKFVQNHTEACT